MKSAPITNVTGDAAVDLSLDTIRIGKQALVFVNSKRSAEATAEKVGKKHGEQTALKPVAEQILAALASPTKQCRRLAYCVERGTAFHHAGLASKQREIVEDAFMRGDLKIIAATPTLAAGVNLPAFRTIIRDLKRYTGAGMSAIPVLEYLQMAGRSGRPDFNDDYGEAIAVAKHAKEAEEITKTYVFGEPEAIYSKVAAMPVLRTYCLSLVATEYVTDREELQGFFAETFFAHQYQDTAGIRKKIEETIAQLQEWGFLEGGASDDFRSASEIASEALRATPLGKRVSELYIDPLSAYTLLTGLRRADGFQPELFAYLQLISSTAEMRPLLRIKPTDYETLLEVVRERKDRLLVLEPSIYEPEYEQYLEATKTARLLEAWAEERTEDDVLETYDVRPGELKARLDIADWLLYASGELSRLLKMHHHISPLAKARTRLSYGAKEELLPLLRLRNIGRIRARILHRNGIRDAGGLAEASAQTLAQLVGPNIAAGLKKQVGQDVDAEALPERKRTGQLSLNAPRFTKGRNREA